MLKLENIAEIAGALLSGQVGVLPTDTIYGLAAAASDKKAVARIYELKNREEKPGTIVAASIDQLVSLGIDKKDIDLAYKYWPGAVSVVLPDDGPDYLDLGGGSLAVRIPDSELLLKLLVLTGPLVTSSANLTRQPASNTVQEAWQYFGDKVDFYVEGGNLSGSQPSTVIRIDKNDIQVLRQGKVKI